jgi:hypothetical protein
MRTFIEHSPVVFVSTIDENGRVDVSPKTSLPSGTVTFLFTDLEGSTRSRGFTPADESITAGTMGGSCLDERAAEWCSRIEAPSLVSSTAGNSMR